MVANEMPWAMSTTEIEMDPSQVFWTDDKLQDDVEDECDEVGDKSRMNVLKVSNDMWENRKSDRKTITGGGTKHSPERKSKSLKYKVL